jgi:hypothetical protein
MPTIHTLGPPYKRTRFTYTGSVKDGAILEIAGRPSISAEFFSAIMHEFKGKTIPGGFSSTIPTPGGLGLWVKENSPRINQVRLSPRHASFIASILVHEGYVTSSFERNAIILHFPERNT